MERLFLRVTDKEARIPIGSGYKRRDRRERELVGRKRREMGKSTVIRAREKSVRRRKERRGQKVERFLTRKRESGERGSDGVEKRGSDISVKERAGLTWDRERERDRVLQSRCLSERTEKVVSVGLARGLPGGRQE